jgi:pyrroline-5-carboxylate reductase
MFEHNLAIIGAGAISEALLKGVLSCDVFSPENIYVVNRKNDERLNYFKNQYKVNITRDYKEIISHCNAILIAVIPNGINEVLQKMKEFITEEHEIISVAAGINTKYIEDKLGKHVQVIRAMPNTSCRVKESATAISTGRYVKDNCIKTAYKIFKSVGKVYQVNEELLDAVTGLSGSGPAYVYYLMEAMIKAGMHVGLDEKVSQALVIQTVFGAAKMVLETGETPKTLREQVTSPNGTTMAGINVLESMQFTEAMIEAVKSAAIRSHELMLENIHQ